MKVVFFGSSDFSIPCLEACLQSGHPVAAAVTTPSRPKGRGLQIQANPVMEKCEKQKLKCLAPETLKDETVREEVRALAPDLFIVASYGKLIPGAWLSLPKKLAINVHPSLLPKYRGAAPIPWQIIDGVKETGVSFAEVTKDLDAGDIFYQKSVPLGQNETTQSLTLQLSRLAAEGLLELLREVEKGTVRRALQKHEASSYAKKLEKEDGHLNLSEPAEVLERKIRAFSPWPGAFVEHKGQPLRIVNVRVGPDETRGNPPGTLIEIKPETGLRIQTGSGVLDLVQVQLPGRSLVSGYEFANGQRLKPGHIFRSLGNKAS